MKPKPKTNKQAAEEAARKRYPKAKNGGNFEEWWHYTQKAAFKAGSAWQSRQNAKKRAQAVKRRVNLDQVVDLEYLLSFGGALKDRRERVQAWLDGVIQGKKGRGK